MEIVYLIIVTWILSEVFLLISFIALWWSKKWSAKQEMKLQAAYLRLNKARKERSIEAIKLNRLIKRRIHLPR